MKEEEEPHDSIEEIIPEPEPIDLDIELPVPELVTFKGHAAPS